jgi:semaphorin 6
MTNASVFQAVYSRVGRVCKNDVGGPHKFKAKWTSFLKARLNCSVPGEMPFHFSEIQSTSSQMVKMSDGDSLVYGVFTTPDNAIAGSAVCSFRYYYLSFPLFLCLGATS